jgi:hypothetical protein
LLDTLNYCHNISELLCRATHHVLTVQRLECVDK